MAKGGHAASGPPPDPNALRRERASDQAGWKVLPKSGREGDTPEFPLHDPTARELQLWEREWRRPQAIEWDRNGQHEEVAMYVRALKSAEAADASVASRTLVKQLQEALGLSLPGMMRLRWRIDDVAATPASPQRSGQRSSPSARERLQVIEGGSSS